MNDRERRGAAIAQRDASELVRQSKRMRGFDGDSFSSFAVISKKLNKLIAMTKGR
jgi:hypothetical protein